MHRARFYAFLIATTVLVGALAYWIWRFEEGNSSGDADHLPFRLRRVFSAGITPDLPIFVADVDLDGNDDLLINEPGRFLWYRLRERGMVLERKSEFGEPGYVRFIADANGDGRPEFFVSIDTTKRSSVSCYDWFSPAGPSEPLYTIGPLLPSQRIEKLEKQKIKFLGCLAAGKGSPARLFIGLNTLKHQEIPRSLHVFDAVTGRQMWDFHFAPHSQNLASGDFGEDDHRVVLTTAAVSNGITCDGSSDDSSFVYCLDERDGRLLWKMGVGGFASRSDPLIADIDGDGRNEVLLARYLAPQDSIWIRERSPWIVAALSGDGTLLSAVALPSPARSLLTADLDGDGYLELLVDGQYGEMVILNRDLTIRKIARPSRGAKPTRSALFDVGDLTADGKPEIIGRLREALTVRDYDGERIAGWQLRRLNQAVIAKCDGSSRVVAATNDSLHVLTLERNPLPARLGAYARFLAPWVVLAGLLGAWTVFHVRRMLKRRRERGISLDEAHDEILKAMAAFGHGGSSLKVIDRLRLHLKNWDRIHADGVTREELFAKLREAYVESVVPEINHIVMLARKARVPEGVWNSLRAEAAFAAEETDTMLAVGSREDTYRREHVVKALGALDAVDGSLAGIRAHLRSIFRTPVAEALERLVVRFREEHGARGASFALVSEAGEAANAFIYPVTFDKIFESLLSNAVRAAEGRTGAEIAVAVQTEGNYCRIDVRDNGCGIPRDDWDRVFDRHYTTKAEGGGFGLYYAREELAKFGGKIYVLASDADSGTTMRVVLRRTEKTGGA